MRVAMAQANEPSGGTGQDSHPRMDRWLIVVIVAVLVALLYAFWPALQ